MTTGHHRLGPYDEYFDGSFDGCSWTGAANASASTRGAILPTHPLLDGNLHVYIGGTNAAGVNTGGLDVTAAVQPGSHWDNTNPGGFGGATLRLEGTLAGAWGPYDALVVKGAPVLVTHGALPIVELYEGEITNDVSHATIQGGQAYYDVTCAGLWFKATGRKDYCQVFADDDYGQWFTLPTNPPAFMVDTDGRLLIALETGQSAKADTPCNLYYWLDSGLGDPGACVAAIFGTLEVNVPASGTWYARLSGGDTPWDDVGTWTTIDSWHNTTVAPNTPFYYGDLTYRCLRLQLYSSSDVASVVSDRYIKLKRISVASSLAAAHLPRLGDVKFLVVDAISKARPSIVTTFADHGLTAGDRVFIAYSDSVDPIDGWQEVATTPTTKTFTMTGVNVLTTAGTSGVVCVAVRIDEAMAAVAETTGLATSSNLQAGGIGAPNWGLNTRPHTDRATAIETFAATNVNPIDWGFWDDATFVCKERAAPDADHDYLIDADTPAVNFAVTADTEDSPTVVKVLYLFRDVDGGTSTYPDGTLLSVYRPAAPTWGDASIVLDVWDQWSDMLMETGQAEDLGDQILAWLAANEYQGTITIATPTIPKRAGGTKNVAYIRAGDYIGETNLETALGHAEKLMITNYSMDADSGVVTLTIGENRRDFVARLKARAVVGMAGEVSIGNGLWKAGR